MFLRDETIAYGVSLSLSVSLSSLLFHSYAFLIHLFFSFDICICSRFKTLILMYSCYSCCFHSRLTYTHTHSGTHSFAHSFSLLRLARSCSFILSLFPLSVCRSVGLPFKYYYADDRVLFICMCIQYGHSL